MSYQKFIDAREAYKRSGGFLSPVNRTVLLHGYGHLRGYTTIAVITAINWDDNRITVLTQNGQEHHFNSETGFWIHPDTQTSYTGYQLNLESLFREDASESELFYL